MENQKEVIVGKVCEIYAKISKLENLNPSNHVNELFTQLVTTCTTHCELDVTLLSQEVKETIAKLIKLCGKAEGLLESHYSAIIGSHENPLNHIKSFPYYSNYLKLSHLEFTMLTSHCTQVPSQLAFIGSGPLPLTSIMLATFYMKNTCFHNYDMDPSANAKAYDLVSSDPDLSKRMFFHTTDIAHVSNALKEYNVVFLAALVGMDKKGKESVINHLAKHMAPGAVLVLRSAHGARAFLYPVVDPSDLKGFEVLSVFHPTDEVINSVIVARKHSVNPGILLSSKCHELAAEGFNTLNHRNVIDELSLTIDEHA
ncbi:nicotianamine synthase-like [Lotus japonicus]|uniref:Nicotianamine synthase n=1 Tax=Lotus japonicus TaxID=34305 RepID=I3SNB0_LOTJA|nr:nicotianamine synthase-like [Lotus japonicus]AFK41752.1 unknown [Lotus japonicus]